MYTLTIAGIAIVGLMIIAGVFALIILLDPARKSQADPYRMTEKEVENAVRALRNEFDETRGRVTATQLKELHYLVRKRGV
jgi:hypothetical protein